MCKFGSGKGREVGAERMLDSCRLYGLNRKYFESNGTRVIPQSDIYDSILSYQHPASRVANGPSTYLESRATELIHESSNSVSTTLDLLERYIDKLTSHQSQLAVSALAICTHIYPMWSSSENNNAKDSPRIPFSVRTRLRTTSSQSQRAGRTRPRR